MKPQEFASEIDAIQALRKRGYTAEFEVHPRALKDLASGRRFAPENVTIVKHYRFEGASDPEDMAVVYAIETDDNVRGLVVDAYGAYANPELAEFLEQVKNHEHA